MNSDDKPQITLAPLRSYGWQRRADLDTSLGQTWESPDGRLHMYKRGVEPVMAQYRQFGLRIDKEVGEKPDADA